MWDMSLWDAGGFLETGRKINAKMKIAYTNKTGMMFVLFS